MILLKMYKLTEQQRWYIIFEWKKGSLNVSRVARSVNYHFITIYCVIDYYRRHNDVNYTDRYNAGRPRVSIQHKSNNLIKLYDRTQQLLALNYDHSHSSTLGNVRYKIIVYLLVIVLLNLLLKSKVTT